MSQEITVQSLAGVWRRALNYEPRDVVADSTLRDGSVVYWAQTPQGAYIDIRCVKAEQWRVRGFAGRIVVSPTDPQLQDPTSVIVTWHRHVDTMPESCPTGIDSATCRVIGDLSDPAAKPTLMEEGDGYLEVWQRVCGWDSDHDRHILRVVEDDLGADVGTFKGMSFSLGNGAVFRLQDEVIELQGFSVNLATNKVIPTADSP